MVDEDWRRLIVVFIGLKLDLIASICIIRSVRGQLKVLFECKVQQAFISTTIVVIQWEKRYWHRSTLDTN